MVLLYLPEMEALPKNGLKKFKLVQLV